MLFSELKEQLGVWDIDEEGQGLDEYMVVVAGAEWMSRIVDVELDTANRLIVLVPQVRSNLQGNKLPSSFTNT